MNWEMKQMSHGQAAVEKSFNRGKSSLQTNITEESIIAKKIVQNHLQANKVNLSSYKFPCKLAVSCNSAYGRYKLSLVEKTKEAEKTVEKERRELFQEESKCLIDKEKNLVTLCNSLDHDFVRFVGDTEKQPEEMSVVLTKANALTRRQNELRMGVNELQKKIVKKRLKLHWFLTYCLLILFFDFLITFYICVSSIFNYLVILW